MAEKKKIAFSDWVLTQTDRRERHWTDRHIVYLARRAARKRTWPSAVGVDEVRAYADADPSRQIWGIHLAYDAYLREVD